MNGIAATKLALEPFLDGLGTGRAMKQGAHDNQSGHSENAENQENSSQLSHQEKLRIAMPDDQSGRLGIEEEARPYRLFTTWLDGNMPVGGRFQPMHEHPGRARLILPVGG
jgi:hypothetical protein